MKSKGNKIFTAIACDAACERDLGAKKTKLAEREVCENLNHFDPIEPNDSLGGGWKKALKNFFHVLTGEEFTI